MLALTSILFIIASIFLSIERPANEMLSIALLPETIKGKLNEAMMFKFEEFIREQLILEISTGRLFFISKYKTPSLSIIVSK